MSFNEVTVECSGPVFDGRADAALRAAEYDIRHEVADAGVGMVRESFAGSIREDRGVFLSTITTTDESRTYSWGGHWDRDIDSGPGKGQIQHVDRVYTMPVVVADPAHETVVTTELAMYGPWLEGTGSRNLTTRFKGYWGFRRAAVRLDAEAEAIAEKAVQPYVAEMND